MRPAIPPTRSAADPFRMLRREQAVASSLASSLNSSFSFFMMSSLLLFHWTLSLAALFGRHLQGPACCLWSPTGIAVEPLFTPEWGDISRRMPGRIHPRAKPVAFCYRGKYRSEGEAEIECSPGEIQVFHKFAIAEILVQVPIAEHHGKPNAETVTDPGKSLQGHVGVGAFTCRPPSWEVGVGIACP